MENSTDPRPSSSAESSQEEPSLNRKRRPHMVCQQLGYLPCKYCPFRTSDRNSLITHEQHHDSRLRSQCTYCTYSSKNSLSLARHTNRVHNPKQIFRSQSKEVLTADSSCPTKEEADITVQKMNEVLMQPNIEKEVMNEPTGGEQEEGLTLQNGSVRTNDTTNIAKEVIVIDITMESDNEEELMMGTEENPVDLSCLCGQPQTVTGNSLMILCDHCKYVFHGICVGITLDKSRQMNEEGKKWLCSHCVHKRSLITHKEKLVQMVNTALNLFPPPLITISPSIAPGSLKDNGFNPQSQDAIFLNISEPSSLPEPSPTRSKKEEELICKSDLTKLESEMNSAQEMLLKMEKSARVERLARSKKAIELRKMIEESQSKDRLKSAKLDFLMKLRERLQPDFHHQLKELTAQKSQLEEEINSLKITLTGKSIKLEPNSASDLVDVNFEADMQQKKQLLGDVKEKLAAIQEEETNLGLRIQVVEQEKREITLNITKMRTDLDSFEGSPSTGSPLSEIAAQLKSIKREQRTRIQHFASLEKRLVQISCGYVLDAIDAIRRKKEERLDA